jgi:hypothetical protein
VLHVHSEFMRDFVFGRQHDAHELLMCIVRQLDVAAM